MSMWFTKKQWKNSLTIAACSLCDSDVVVAGNKTTKAGTPIWSCIYDQGGHFWFKYNDVNCDIVFNQSYGMLKEKVGK